MLDVRERNHPDTSDVIHLYRHSEIRPDRDVLRSTLEKKCAFKGIAVPSVASLENRPERAELETEWANMLGHQLPQLPPFDQFWKEIPEVLSWVQGTTEKAVLASAPVGQDIDRSWQPPPMIHAWHARVPFEVIRFAAANRLCVDLRYQGSIRQIEPYSLRRTKEGDLLLFAVKHQTGELRSYRVDRIEGAAASRVSFIPRFMVELTPAGGISVPPTARWADPKPVRPRKQSPEGGVDSPSGYPKRSGGIPEGFQGTVTGKRGGWGVTEGRCAEPPISPEPCPGVGFHTDLTFHS